MKTGPTEFHWAKSKLDGKPFAAIISSNSLQTHRACGTNTSDIGVEKSLDSKIALSAVVSLPAATLETTQWQVDGFFNQLEFKCYLPEVASMGD